MIFKFNNKQYEYADTPNPDRRVEIPIIKEYLREYKGKNILEIGNVLVNFCSSNHDIVDKYDTAKYCINEDIINYHSISKYDFIVSISTLEHIGYEPPEEKDETKVIRTVHHIKQNLLKEGGEFVFTIPLGFNKILDEQMMNENFKIDEKYFMKRISLSVWEQDFDPDMIAGYYDNPFGCANKILIGVIK